MSKINTILSVLAILTVAFPLNAIAADFDNGNIIADKDLTNYNSMSLADIQEFLSKKSGTLAKYYSLNKNGVQKSAVEIIYDASQEYRINPQFLLVMLQKEQSLVEDNSPTRKQYDWAMGYGISDDSNMNDPSVQKYKGFGIQVDYAAGWQRWCIDNANNGWLKIIGRIYNIDGQRVVLQNQATANLYNYTPHVSGNYNFWKIWNRWFTQSYPDGTLLQADNGRKDVWIILDGRRRLFASKTALLSRYDISKIVAVSENELEKYEIGKPIKYPDYSILKSPFGNVYLLVDDTLRKFESDKVWRTLGFNPEEFVDAPMEDFALFTDGEPITLSSAYPTGALLQDKAAGGVFFVQDGIKYPLIAKDIMLINFPRKKIIQVTKDELDKYANGDSVKIRDGEIVRTRENSAVFVISDGKKMPISSMEILTKLGYKAANIRFVDEKSLSNMPQGNYLNLEFKK